MPFLTVTGVPPYDGRYELKLDGDVFTIYEWGLVKRLAGYYPATLWDGFENGDKELVATLAVIALYRAGRITARDTQDVFDLIGQRQAANTIDIENESVPAEEDGQPPLPLSETANGGSTGPSSRPSSALSENHQAPTGTPASGISGSA